MEMSEAKRFGRYEIVAELGRGAMGVVYKARDPQIDRMVAVKTVSLWGQEPEEEKEFRLRFQNEAQAAGRLHHSGIVSVFDVGEDPENHDPYIVLEYVAGETLNRVLSREKKLPLATALKIAEEIADALDYAHGQGVIHRDIKPANILITETGHAKIADFGIAKLNLAHFTIPGRVLGTPAYMAPEQLSGEGCDGRSDLFSLGVILYVMVTGLSPFQGSSATTVCFKVANREPMAASALDMNLPTELDAVISKAIAKSPAERYQTGAEFAEDLQVLQQTFAPTSTTSSLRAVAATGTRSMNRTASLTPPHVRQVKTVAQFQNLIPRLLAKASLRDLILGVGTLALLVILATQSKLLTTAIPKEGVTASSTTSTATDLESPKPPLKPVVQEEPSSPKTKVRKRKGVHVKAPVKTRTGAANETEVATAKPIVVPPASTPTQVVAPVLKPIVIPSATLDLDVQHQFKDATLFLWIDDKLALTRPMHGRVQKTLGLFNGIHGAESNTLKIPAGRHVLRFRALSADQATDLSKTISAEFAGGGDKTLHVTFERHNTIMHLNWQ